MKNLNLVFVLVVLFTMSHFETVHGGQLSCRITFDIFPNQDLTYDHSRSSLPSYRVELKRLNDLLAPEHRFSSQQLEKVAISFAYPGTDDLVQLRQMVGFPPQTDGWFSALGGRNEDWEEPVYQWLRSLVEKPLPTREEILQSRDRSHHARNNQQTSLNAIDQHRFQMARNHVIAIEKEIGQPIFSSETARNEQLNWIARTNYNYDQFVHSMDQLRSTPPSFPLSKWYTLLQAFARGIDRMHMQDERFSAMPLLITLIKNPELQEEVRFYLGKATEIANEKERLSWVGAAYILIRRLRGIYNGEKTFHDTIHNVIAEKLIESYRFANISAQYGSGPYVGRALHYSLNKSVLRDPLRTKSVAEFSEALEALKVADIRLQFLGTMHFQTKPKIFGQTISKEVSHSIEYVFAAEVRLGQQLQHFAISVEPTFREEAGATLKYSMEDLNRSQLLDLELLEVRQTARAPRLSDATQTRPFDLSEPMVKLTPGTVEGKPLFKNDFNSLLLTRAPMNKQSKEERPLEEAKLDILQDFASALFAGEENKGENTLRFKLFKDNRQVDPIEYELPLVSEKPGQQVFELAFYKSLQKVKIRVTRDLLTGQYLLETQTSLGLFPQIKIGSWRAQFSP